MEVPVSSIINTKSVVANVFSILIFRFFLSLLLFLYLSLSIYILRSLVLIFLIFASLSLFLSHFFRPQFFVFFVHSKHTHMYVVPFCTRTTYRPAYRVSKRANQSQQDTHTLFPYSFRWILLFSVKLHTNVITRYPECRRGWFDFFFSSPLFISLFFLESLFFFSFPFFLTRFFFIMVYFSLEGCILLLTGD